LISRLDAFARRCGVPVPGLDVVDSGMADLSGRAGAARFARFGREAARPLADLLSRSEVFAVTWGMTISQCIDGLKATLAPEMMGRSIRIVPVCGEPRGQASHRHTSSRLAERLHDQLRSSARQPPSLTGVPALIPRKFHGAEARVIRRFVGQSGSYRAVFRSSSPLIDRVDSLLTSVGPSNRPMGFLHEELLAAGSTRSRRLTTESLSRLVIGDIGGVLIPRPGLAEQGRLEVDALNAMWTGITLSHLKRMSRQAGQTRRPGVIVASLDGDERAHVIAEAIRAGIVNHLIIDRSLADALTAVLDQDR
jgi:DNA-binding transcriptional regulator LsrR (DeoR family)